VVVAGAQARHCRVSGRYAAADDARQVFGLVLFEVPSEVAHASLWLDVPAFLALDQGFAGCIGISLGISVVIRVVRGGVGGR
jgi:hypothetical protein